MSQVGIAGVIAACMATQALAASNVGFTLELGGDNHAAAYKAGTPQFFTPGGTTDGQVFAANSTVTWGMRLAASGTDSGGPIQGVANFVFDLELHEGSGAGPLVTNPPNIFKSTVNDGQNGDIMAAAAFAFSFNVASVGPGRVVDQQSGFPPPHGYIGGPLCGGVDNSADFLKSATYPTPEAGKLIGMGAGYNAWLGGGTGKTNKGIGMTFGPPENTSPNQVICEGQLDLTGLPFGTYVLKVIPAAGNNVLRGGLALGVNQNSFATAADSTTGDEITFVIGNPPAGKAITPNPPHDPPGLTPLVTLDPVTLSWTAGTNATAHDVYFGTSAPPPLVSSNQPGTTHNAGVLSSGHYYWRIDERNADGVVTTGDVWEFHVNVPAQITQWRSVRTHGSALGVVLSGTGTTTEARQGGIRLIEVDFDRQCGLFSPGDPIIAMGSDTNAYPSTAVNFVNNDQTLQIEFASGLPDQVCYTIDLTNIVGDFDFAQPIGGDVDCTVRNLYGDANPMSGGTVNLSDVLLIKARIGTSVSASPWADLDMNAAIDAVDVMASKSQLANTVCP